MLCLKDLAVKNNLAYCVHSQVTKKLRCCEYGCRGHIHNTTFSLKLSNGPKKPEHCILLGWKGLALKNNLAYWVHLQVTKKLRCCKYGHSGHIHNTIFFVTFKWTQEAGALHLARLERVGSEKQSSLLGPSAGYKEIEVL
jgi:hypothetical protein